MAKKDDATGLTSALKEQLALITFVVLFAGMVSTETYYAGFGIHYQLLELSVPHLVERGLTAVVDSPVLMVAYLIAIAWLSAGAAWLAAKKPRLAALVQPVTYALILAIVIISYFSAIAAGRHAAMLDLSSDSRLPVVQAMTSKDGKALPFTGFRLLTAGNDTVVVFNSTRTAGDSVFIHLLKRDDLGDITITR